MSQSGRLQSRKESDVCIQGLFSQLLEKIKTYNSHFDEEKLKQAFESSLKAHDGQFRESGEPYIIHPLSVALILTEYYVGENTIIAALFHDVLEDSDEVSYNKLKNNFGDRVARLVEGVTKINEFVSNEHIHTEHVSSYKASDAETIRKVFREARQDIRIVLIKLADRLHNMKTLGAIASPVKRYRKAQETLAIFVPMAARLGIWKMKHELENLCFPYVSPDEYEVVRTFLEKNRDHLDKTISSVMRDLQEVDENGTIQAMYSYNRGIFYLKEALDERGMLTINDYLTLHVCVDNEDDCYLALGLIHKTWKTRKRKEEDYISNPRDNGYQAYHTRIVNKDGFLVEIRIMTHEMRLRNWYGGAYGCFQKQEGDGAHTGFLTPFETISEKTHGKSFEFLEAAKTDLLEEKIEVHTSGKSVYVPGMATALDFVFYAFSKKAFCVSKIYLNDKEASFDMRLNDGDIIKVDFADGHTLSFKWFTLVKTATARMMIQEMLRSWDLRTRVDVGKKILQREFDIYDKGNVDVFLNKHRKEMYELFEIKDPKDLYVLLSGGELSSYEVFLAFFPKTKESFSRRLIYKWDAFLDKFLGGARHVLRLKIMGILENEVDILGVMNAARRNLGMTTISSNLRENRKSNIFNFRINVSADDEKTLHDFFMLVEHQKGVVRVSPLLSYRNQRWFLFWFFVTVIMWVLFPFILSWEKGFIVAIPSFFRLGLLYFNLVPLAIVNYILYSFMRNYFPQLRNTVWVIVIGLLLNLFGFIVFSWHLVVHGFHVNLPILIAFFSIITFIFFYKYLSSVYYFELPKPVSEKITIHSKIYAYICASLVVLIWGIDPLIIRHLVSDTNLYFVIGMRFYLGAAFLFLFIFLRKILLKKKYSSTIRFTPLFWMMVIGIAFNFINYHVGLRYTLASDANLIENFSPIMVFILMSLFSFGVAHQLGRSKKDIIRMFLVVFVGSLGAILIFWNFPEKLLSNYNMKLFGDFIEVIAMVFLALFILSNNVYMKKNRDVSSLAVMAYIFLVAGILFSPFAFFNGLPDLDPRDWSLILFLGFFSTGAAYALWSKAAKTLNVIPAVLLLNLMAIVTITAENRIYGLPINFKLVAGAMLIITAAIAAEVLNRKKTKMIEARQSSQEGDMPYCPPESS